VSTTWSRRTLSACTTSSAPGSPGYQLPWKQDGRTISRILSTKQVALYREWVDNRRALEVLLDEIRDLSREATEQLAAETGVGFVGLSRPRRDRRRKR